MSFPRYPAYKDSGVKWLGQVPAHWGVQPCRAVFTERSERNDPLVNEEYLSLMANVGVIPYADKGDVGNKKPEDLTKCKLVFAGDLVINSMNYGIGSYGLSALTGVCSPVYIVLKPKLDRIEERYAFRILENKAFQGFAQSHGNGILEHRAAINWDILKGIGVPLPPVSEQQSILGFLDHETAKIDALVAEQERLIELLKEKRQAVISHAVTKGLDPSVPMKDSGVEWLGEVPAHWTVQPLGTLTHLIQTGPFGSQLHSDEYVDDATPVVNPSNIIDGQICADLSVTVTEEVAQRLAHQKLVSGDIVVGRRGEMGRCAVVQKSQEGWLCGTGSLKLHLTATAIPDFIWRYLSTDLIKQYLSLQSVGSTMENLNTQILARVPVPVPTKAEQAEICTSISEQMKALNNLELEAVQGVQLLRERRTALISAAVTGQIDVRGWTPAPDAP